MTDKEKQIPFPDIKLFEWSELPKYIGNLAGRLLAFNWSRVDKATSIPLESSEARYIDLHETDDGIEPFDVRKAGECACYAQITWSDDEVAALHTGWDDMGNYFDGTL